MPLASNLIAFILPLGFHGMHIGLECLHGFKGFYSSIFTVAPTKEFNALAHSSGSITSLTL
jgi:hypothetical protein